MNPEQTNNRLASAVEPTTASRPGATNPVAGEQPSVGIPASASPQQLPTVAPTTVVPPPEPQPKPSRRHFKNWKSVLSSILLFILAPILALSITAFAFQSYQVDGQSMEITLQDRDRLIVNKTPRTWSRITHHSYIPKRGDIIIFNQAGLFDAGNSQQKQLIKRVVGLPGERVVVKDGLLTIYNKQYPDGYNPDKTGQYTITAPSTPGNVDVTLQDDDIFVCGDNRTNSEDSRYFGPVHANNVVGKLSLRILPLSKIKKF